MGAIGYRDATLLYDERTTHAWDRPANPWHMGVACAERTAHKRLARTRTMIPLRRMAFRRNAMVASTAFPFPESQPVRTRGTLTPRSGCGRFSVRGSNHSGGKMGDNAPCVQRADCFRALSPIYCSIVSIPVLVWHGWLITRGIG
jgi:hypothetical protein